jgi:hypothetical protein
MRYPLYWALLKHCPGGGDQVKIRSRRLDYVVQVDTIKQSGDTVAPKICSPGSDVVKRANLANHGSNNKEAGHFAAVRTLICRSTGYNVHSLAPVFLRCCCWWNIHSRAPINTRFGFESPGGGAVLIIDTGFAPHPVQGKGMAA